MTYHKPDLLTPRDGRNSVIPTEGNGTCIVCGGNAL